MLIMENRMEATKRFRVWGFRGPGFRDLGMMMIKKNKERRDNGKEGSKRAFSNQRGCLVVRALL